MEKRLRIFIIVLAALLVGATANSGAANPEAAWLVGMGPGMMGGYGQGMGSGMMGGHGHGYGMGHGMMGFGDLRALNLSDDQKAKITKIRKAMRAKHWELMDDMMDAQDQLQDLYDADKQDAAAINKQHKVIEDLRRQMVENSVEAHNQISAILTKEQREKARELRRGYGPRMHGY